MKYWLHRISHEWDVSYVLLKNGYLSIGHSWYAQFENWREWKGELGEELPLRLRNFAGMEVGDVILVPLNEATFSIYRVEEKAVRINEITHRFINSTSISGEILDETKEGLFCYKQSGKTIDLGFVIKVTPLCEKLLRYRFADNQLTSYMKYRGTNTQIKKPNVWNSIEQAIINAETNTPINLYAELIEENSKNVLDKIKKRLTPNKFEKLIKWYMQKLGAKVETLPTYDGKKKDKADADVEAIFEKLKIIVYIQAKLHNKETSRWAVEQIKKYKEQKESVTGYTILPWVISTCDTFSEEAELEATGENIRLINGLEFARMLMDEGIENINEAFE